MRRAVATRGVLSGPAIGRINDSVLEALVISDSIPLTEEGQACDKIRVVTLAPLLGEAVRRIHTGDSVSSLFNLGND